MVLSNKMFNLWSQPKQEVSSAGEQLISDRADGYTVMEVDGLIYSSTFIMITGILHRLKNSFQDVIFSSIYI